ncbi:hypothetical protein L6164_004571 [Bauhinia variegata]|uniref:Uncharacterized protein n=1 Tax=Bauhinia variegata TaxID=167791 RepID=A0ACB9QAJ1_BAUVA|nr:hypothetical protein L6164_004571 [Bauhinia variegata]
MVIRLHPLEKQVDVMADLRKKGTLGKYAGWDIGTRSCISECITYSRCLPRPCSCAHSLTTRTLHSELVYNYAGSKHITESLKRCGISDSTTYILAARFDATPDEMKAIEKLTNGKEIELEELDTKANRAQIQKHYKIAGAELGISSLADAITCRIASRDVL